MFPRREKGLEVTFTRVELLKLHVCGMKLPLLHARCVRRDRDMLSVAKTQEEGVRSSNVRCRRL